MNARYSTAIRRLLPLLLVALPGSVLHAQTVQAVQHAAPELMSLGDVQRGQLLFRTTEHGRYAPAPLVATEVDIDVSGIVARATVKQYFVNPTKKWLEGRYVFPLPENAAVNHMKMVIGERVIEAKIAERSAARRAYEAARKSGRRAALVEQHRPNIFSNNVANIPPGGRIAVQLHYVQRLGYDSGKFSLRFPLVVAPRFDPAGGVRHLVKQPVPDNGDGMPAPLRAALPPVVVPVHNTEQAPPLNPVALTVTLAAGMALNDAQSVSHKVDIANTGTGKRRVTLTGKTVPADRDFTLHWTPALAAEPLVAAFRETVGSHVFVTALVMPPAPQSTVRRTRSRDIVFILDRSGSMGGVSIRAARAALDTAIDRLGPQDRFNLIRFSNETDSLFDQAMQASDTNRLFAKLYLRDTRAGGGTVMRPALHAALRGHSDDGGAEEGRLRQIVFVTDGAVANETELFRDIRSRLGDSRLFTIGIGSAPNSYFMRKAAEAGRGAFVYIPDVAKVKTHMTSLFDKLERPALTGISYAWAGGNDPSAPPHHESFPAAIPDLYVGDPVILVSRLESAVVDENAVLTLRAGNWKTDLRLGDARPAKGIATLWARDKIMALSDSLRDGAPAPAVKAAITRIGLAHSLVTRHTSLLATEKTVSRPQGAPLVSGDAPVNLPHGWRFDTTLGKGAAVGSRKAQLKRSAAPPRAPKDMSGKRVKFALATRPVTLPAGATPFFVHLAIGIGLLLMAAVVFVVAVPSRRLSGRRPA
jgi:Ca-activated chloride channel homolog